MRFIGSVAAEMSFVTVYTRVTFAGAGLPGVSIACKVRTGSADAQSRIALIAYLVTLELAPHRVRALNNIVDHRSDMLTERHVDSICMSAGQEPGRNLITSVQRQLLLKIELRIHE